MSTMIIGELDASAAPDGFSPSRDEALDADWMELASLIETILGLEGWVGSYRDVIEVLPQEPKTDRALEVRNAVARLGFSTRVLVSRRVDPREADRLARNHDGHLSVLLQIPDGGKPAILRRGAEGWPLASLKTGGTLIAFEPRETLAADSQSSWVGRQVQTSLPMVAKAILLTFFANLMALANPFFVMTVYDKVIAGESRHMLIFLVGGAVLAAGFEMAARRLRARIMCHASLRLGYVVGNSVLGRLLGLPCILTERAGISAQLARVKDIDRVRDLLSGPVEQAILDLPFGLLFLLAIAAIGSWLALIPLGAMVFFGLLAIAGNAHLKRRTAFVAQANAKRQVVALEMIDRMRAIRSTGAAGLWLDRFQTAVQRSSRSAETHAYGSFVLATVSQTFGTIVALSTLLAGIAAVFSQAMTTGALIACMMMVWRLLGPIQNAFTASTRLGQLRASVAQIDTLMRTPPERVNIPHPGAAATIKGRITFNHVTFRYGRESDPILGNVSFQAEPGEIIAILGRNGGGKSTVLKLVAGLYTAQGGNIRIDDRDIRQFDPIHLRRSIAYVSQVPQFFHGTLFDNLRMAAPDASGIEIIEALEKAGALDAVTSMKDGLQTSFDSRTLPLPAGLMARLSLARAYLRNTPIVLLDEPATGFDFEGEFAFIDALESLRRRNATVLLVTHRRRYVGIADKVLILENGTCRYFGSAEKVKDRIPKGMM